MRWTGHVARLGTGEAYTGFCWKNGGKENTWKTGVDEDNIKMDLQEVECGDMDWINLARDRDRWRALVNEVINLRVT
jgi:hypothetical protein